VHGRTFPLGSYKLIPMLNPKRILKEPELKGMLEKDFERLREILQQESEA
jgi:uracil-DNA glycosylase